MGNREIIKNRELEFLRESNKIEGVYSHEALIDSVSAWEYAKKYKKPIDKFLIKKIHRILMKRLDPNIAGKFRKIQVGVMTRDRGFVESIHWKEIEEEIRLLCNHGLYPTTSWNLIKRHHIQFEHIHPFRDGNGRVGRIIMNLLLYRNKLPIKVIHQGEEQQSYYKWFRKK